MADFSADFTRRLKVKYTSRLQPHQAIFRISDTTNQTTFISTVGPAFLACLHNTDVIVGWEMAAKGSNVFLPVTAPVGTTGAGGRSGVLPTLTGMLMATQLTVSGRTANGGRWKFVYFQHLYSEYDDFVINVDELDAADLDFIASLIQQGEVGNLVGNDGSSVLTIYPRYTVKINDHYVQLYRRTRAG